MSSHRITTTSRLNDKQVNQARVDYPPLSLEALYVSISAKRLLECGTSDLIRKKNWVLFQKYLQKVQEQVHLCQLQGWLQPRKKLALELKEKLKSKAAKRVKTFKTKSARNFFPREGIYPWDGRLWMCCLLRLVQQKQREGSLGEICCALWRMGSQTLY